MRASMARPGVKQGCRDALAALPAQSQQHADAGGDQDGLQRLLMDVALPALFPLLCALPALVVVLRGLVAELVVSLSRHVAALAADVAEVLADLRRGLADPLPAL